MLELLWGAMATFRSPLPPKLCEARLSEAISPNMSLMASFRGTVGDNHLTVWCNRGRNSFRPIFFGRIEADGDGALISGRFRTEPIVLPLVVIFLIAWLPTNGFFGVILSAPVLLFPLVLVVMIGFCRFLARDEPRLICEMIADVTSH